MIRKKNKQQKLHLLKGDMVKVIAGNSKGKTGKVQLVIPSKQRAIIEGVNMITKHIKPSANTPNGAIEKQEGSIHISNLMVIDPSSGEPTRIGRKQDDKGKLQRFSKKTGEFIKNG
ncbi:MAG: 50S ribosomal protein L24 [Cyclobacteriaceae bacterium]